MLIIIYTFVNVHKLIWNWFPLEIQNPKQNMKNNTVGYIESFYDG